ncbi:TIGR01620 family protein [Rheinheimera sp.]|uniref:TIGR01620 family protein n=1 Tax=Rheinheimera sp. TaxID=1869214 RepID=UPI00307E2F1E
MKPLKPAVEFETQSQAEIKTLPVQAKDFDPADFVEADLTEPVSEVPQGRGVGRWLAAALLSFLAYGGWQLIDTVLQLIRNPGAGTFFSAVLAVSLTGLVLVLLGREYRLWRRLKQGELWQQSAERIQQSMQYGEALPLCQQMLKQLPATPASVQQFHQHYKTEHSDKEVLQLFELSVLNPLDKQVQQQIHQAAADTSLAVTLSPFVLADLLLVLWRSSRMLREIAQSYGASIGQLRSLLLLKRLFASLVWAGGSELALDLSSEVVGTELTSRLSARAGQGLIAGLLTARLGLAAQQLLRPVPLPEQQKLSLRQLGKALMQRLSGTNKE